MIKPLRLFIAIDLTDATKNAIQQCCQPLKKHPQLTALNWTKLENLHITLRFLGDTPPAKLDPIINALQQQTKLTPFTLRTTKVTVFPPQHERLLVLLVHLSHELAALYQQVNQTLSLLALAQDPRPFLPHITVARAKPTTHFPFIPELMTTVTLEQQIDHICLYQSDTRPEGSCYTVLKRFFFNNQFG